jgi:hypothetical protein
MGHGCDAHKRIGGAHARANRLTIGIRPKTIAQEGGIALIDLIEASNRRSGIGKGLSGWAPIDAESSGFLNIQPVDFKIEASRIDQLIR